MIMAVFKFKVPAKVLRGMVDRFTYGEDWWILERENHAKYKLWQKVNKTTELTEEEHKLFIEDLTSGVAHMEDIVSENSEYADMRERVAEYRAAIKWIKEYLNNYNGNQS
jgi:hypothetical protein